MAFTSFMHETQKPKKRAIKATAVEVGNNVVLTFDRWGDMADVRDFMKDAELDYRPTRLHGGMHAITVSQIDYITLSLEFNI